MFMDFTLENFIMNQMMHPLAIPIILPSEKNKLPNLK